jgi:hypothetical protein
MDDDLFDEFGNYLGRGSGSEDSEGSENSEESKDSLSDKDLASSALQIHIDVIFK